MFYQTIINLPIKDIANNLVLLATTFLAVDITAFVLATTFLGEAIELSKAEKVKTEQKDIKLFSEKIESLKAEQVKLNISSDEKELKMLMDSLSELLKQKTKSENNLIKIENRYGTLKFKNSVLVPGLFLVISIILCLAILYFFNDLNTKISILFFSLFTIIYAVYLITYLLSVIETVALGSDERRWLKHKEMFELALQEHESKSRPKPVLHFKTSQPLILYKNAEAILDAFVELEDDGGDVAEDCDISFFISPDLDFIEQDGFYKDAIQEQNFIIAGAITACKKMGNLNKDTKYRVLLHIKAKDKEGKFSIRYRISCKHYIDSLLNTPEFIVLVKSQTS